MDIGPQSEDSQVAEPVPFPDDRLPPGNLIINVVVSSSMFTVGRDPSSFTARTAEEDRFVLPGDGGPARAPDGGTLLTFVVGAPSTPGTAVLRIVYYYRGAVIQSQLLSAYIGGRDEAGADRDPWSLSTDYTVATVLVSVAAIPDRPRVAAVLNGDAAGHQIYVRTPRRLRPAGRDRREPAASDREQRP